MKRRTVVRTIQFLALLVALATGLSVGVAAGNSVTSFASEQILPPYYPHSVGDTQAAPVVDNAGDEHLSWERKEPFPSDGEARGSFLAWAGLWHRHDLAWRDLFLLSRFNTKYKEAR